MDKKDELEKLKRQLERLQHNFIKMVKDSDKADMMLDWMNEIRKRIKELEK